MGGSIKGAAPREQRGCQKGADPGDRETGRRRGDTLREQERGYRKRAARGDQKRECQKGPAPRDQAKEWEEYTNITAREGSEVVAQKTKVACITAPQREKVAVDIASATIATTAMEDVKGAHCIIIHGGNQPVRPLP